MTETPVPHDTALKIIDIFKLTDGFKTKYTEKVRRADKKTYDHFQVHLLYESTEQIGTYGTVNLAINEMGIGIVVPLLFDKKEYLIEVLSQAMFYIRGELLLIRKYGKLLNKAPGLKTTVKAAAVPKRPRAPPK